MWISVCVCAHVDGGNMYAITLTLSKKTKQKNQKTFKTSVLRGYIFKDEYTHMSDSFVFLFFFKWISPVRSNMIITDL